MLVLVFGFPVDKLIGQYDSEDNVQWLSRECQENRWIFSCRKLRKNNLNVNKSGLPRQKKDEGHIIIVVSDCLLPLLPRFHGR